MVHHHEPVRRGHGTRGTILSMTPLPLPQVQQFFLLSQTDRLWKDHLQAMKFLQTAIGLRGYAQRVRLFMTGGEAQQLGATLTLTPLPPWLFTI